MLTPIYDPDFIPRAENFYYWALANQRLPRHIRKKLAVDDNGCWLWTGGLTQNGYGKSSLTGLLTPWRRGAAGHTYTQGSNAGTSKLTEAQVQEIRHLLSDGLLTQREIAKKFEVGQTQVSRINTGRRWAHLNKGGCNDY